MYTVVDACSAASYSSCVPENRRSLYADSLLGSLKRDAIGRKRGGGRRARFARSTEKGRRWGIFCDFANCERNETRPTRQRRDNGRERPGESREEG